MLKTVALKSIYRSETESLLNDFYIPALSASVRYDRAVGYFSSTMMSYAAQGISAFVRQNGTMRLIVGYPLEPEEFDAVTRGAQLLQIQERVTNAVSEMLSNISHELVNNRLEALCWLIAAGRLQIKFALRPRGMYHEKMGVLYDPAGDAVVFQGSANETTYALAPDLNWESISVYRSWQPEVFEEYGRPFVLAFERLWSGTARNAKTIDIPSDAYRVLANRAPRRPPLGPEFEIAIYQEATGEVPQANAPHIPLTIGGEPFEMRPHQRDALDAWRRHAASGILEHATGSGKTITAIYALVKIYEAYRRLFAVVAVPYQALADQWIEVLQLFGVHAIPCYAARQAWTERLDQELNAFLAQATRIVVCVVVNNTLQSTDFQRKIARVANTRFLFVGDECHNLGSPDLAKALPQNANLRLGISATPFHHHNAEANQRLTSYFGVVAHRYDLEAAIADGFLTPYRYFPHVTQLEEDEWEEYAELTRQVGAHSPAEGEDASDPRVNALLMKRARLVASCRNKIPALRELLANRRPQPFSLFYCGDGWVEDPDTGFDRKQLDVLTRLLSETEWRTSRFTARESLTDRRATLDAFKLGAVHGLVAMRCLDEGIDVPACRLAFILASSKNPRQYIQRRGRILRRSPGKTEASIHDFLVLAPSEHMRGSMAKNLAKGELLRAIEFARLALNHGDVYEELSGITTEHGLIGILSGGVDGQEAR